MRVGLFLVASGYVMSSRIKKHEAVINKAPQNWIKLPLALNGLSLPCGQPTASPATHPRTKSAQMKMQDHRNDASEIKKSGNARNLLSTFI
jgi:hypothetical protein